MSPARGRRRALLGGLIFAVVMLLRVIALSRIANSPFLLPAHGDMHFYNQWALRILRGEWTDHLAFYGLPLYAYMLAGLYKIFGYNPFVPGLLQAAVDAGTAVIICQLAVQIFEEKNRAKAMSADSPYRAEIVGCIAGLGWGLFMPAQAYSVILMPTAWLVFVFWLLVWLIVARRQAPRLIWMLLIGLAVGVTAMGVATILFLIPLLLAAVCFKWEMSGRRARIIGACVILVGAITGTLPAFAHNYFVAHDPVLLSAHSGINLWIGNNPEANGYPRFPPGLRAGQSAMLQDSIAAAESVAGHSLKRSEVSAYWSNKARAYVTQHPRDWVKLLGIKVRNFWSSFQYDDLSIISVLRDGGIIFQGLSFGVVAAFALPGAFVSWRSSLSSRWVLGAILLQTCALLPVFVTERYRLAAVPGLLVLAVLGLATFWQSCVANDRSRVAFYLVALIASALLISWPQNNPSLWALDAYNSGRQALEANELRLAEQKLELARAYVPENVEVNFAMGELRQVQGRPNEAKQFYAATLALDRKHKGALNNLGVLAQEENNPVLAEKFFRAALERAPSDAKTHFQIARSALMQGDVATAENEIGIALKILPEQPEFLALRQELIQRQAR